MKCRALAICLLLGSSVAFASPPAMYLEESALQVVRGQKLTVVLTDGGLLLSLKNAGEPRPEFVWRSDRWHQVVPVELWRREGIFVVRLEVSRDSNAIVLAEPNLEVESREPTYVIATMIDPMSGQTKATIRLGDVVRNVGALKQKPFKSPKFHWGFVDSIAHNDVLRIFTCEGRWIEYDLSGHLLGDREVPNIPDPEVVCGHGESK